MEKIRKKTSCSCHDCEIAVIAGTAQSDPQIQRHLQECPSCREFAGFQQEILTLEPAVKHPLPEFDQIRTAAGNARQKRQKHLRIWLAPLGAAAVAAIFIGGMILNLPSGGNIPAGETGPANYYLDDVIMTALLEESSIKMTWDQTSSGESRCIDSMQAARQGSDQWSIELSNLYSEEWL